MELMRMLALLNVMFGSFLKLKTQLTQTSTPAGEGKKEVVAIEIKSRGREIKGNTFGKREPFSSLFCHFLLTLHHPSSLKTREKEYPKKAEKRDDLAMLRSVSN